MTVLCTLKLLRETCIRVFENTMLLASILPVSRMIAGVYGLSLHLCLFFFLSRGIAKLKSRIFLRQVRAEREVIMAAVSKDGLALAYAAQELQGDEDIVEAGCCGAAVKWELLFVHVCSFVYY